MTSEVEEGSNRSICGQEDIKLTQSVRVREKLLSLNFKVIIWKVFWLRSHCSQILYLWIYLLTNTYLFVTPKAILSIFTVAHMHEEAPNLRPWSIRFQLRSNKGTLSLLVSVSGCEQNSLLFARYLVPSFLHFSAFCWWFHSFKWPQV